jgi:hypothetical protein
MPLDGVVDAFGGEPCRFALDSSMRLRGRFRDRPCRQSNALAPHAETDKAGGQPPQNRKIDEEAHDPRRRDLAGASEDTQNHLILDKNLHALNGLRWPFAGSNAAPAKKGCASTSQQTTQ